MSNIYREIKFDNAIILYQYKNSDLEIYVFRLNFPYYIVLDKNLDIYDATLYKVIWKNNNEKHLGCILWMNNDKLTEDIKQFRNNFNAGKITDSLEHSFKYKQLRIISGHINMDVDAQLREENLKIILQDEI